MIDNCQMPLGLIYTNKTRIAEYTFKLFNIYYVFSIM